MTTGEIKELVLTVIASLNLEELAQGYRM